MNSSLFFLLLLVGIASCSINGWEAIESAPKGATITIHFALTQRNQDILEQTLFDVSDVTSPNYGKWWKAEEITELVAPPKSVSKRVAAFLLSEGAKRVEDRRDSIKVTFSVERAEVLLQVSLHTFRHVVHQDKYIIRSLDDYFMPYEIEDDVDFIAGLYEFPILRQSHEKAVFEGEDALIVPETINSLYQIPSNFTVHPNSSLCVGEFLNDTAVLPGDLKLFAQGTATPLIKISDIVGNFSGSNLESSLDVEYGGVTSQGTKLWFWSESEWMYDFATDLMANPNPPLVVSMSWGWPETNQCGRVINCTKGETSFEYVSRTNVEFAKLGLRGVTLVASSGDNGAPGDLNVDCAASGKSIFSSIFPGASPFVLSVGATMLTNSSNPNTNFPPICVGHGCATSTTEIVCTYPISLITTGGGFSDYSPLPTWQQQVVTSYLKSGVELPPTKYFNASNRAFPDVSALGHNFVIAMGNAFSLVDGTSASTPVWAAIISLLNSHRLNNNKPPLGFIPPLLYQAYASDPSIFNDVTSGDNKCTEACCDKYGYEATAGWDPATGLGTPVFPKLLQYVANLP